MEYVVLLLLSPVIFAQSYQKANDPNDEPFLPIFPVYPYNPKLMKRGVDREAVTQIASELYAPKVDATETYSASYSNNNNNNDNNYSRDSYYPNYNPYPKASTSSTYSSYYNTAPYTYSTVPYNYYSSPYQVTNPYIVPYSATSYPSYYLQPHYYYPGYYNQAFLPPPPPPPPSSPYSSPAKDPSDIDLTNEEKDKTIGTKDHDSAPNMETGNNYVEGKNYISSSSKDLDSQPSTYKEPLPYNQLEQLTELYLKNLAAPKPTFRLVAITGQPTGADYPLPGGTYVKAQQLEQLMRQTLAKLIAQNNQLAQNLQAAQSVQHNSQLIQYPTHDINQNTLQKSNEGYVHQNSQNAQPYVTIPNVLAKPGLAYVLNPQNIAKINLAQVNPGQAVQASTTLTKTTKYPGAQYVQKPVTRLTLEEATGMYIPPNKSAKYQASVQPVDYEGYENPSTQDSQNYESSLSQNENTKQEQTGYSVEQGKPPGIYHKKNYVTVQAPQTYTYQYSTYRSPQTTAQQPHYKTNSDDVNYGEKTNSDA